MSSAVNTTAQRRFDQTRLMIVHGEAEPEFGQIGDITNRLGPDDLLVMNVSATIPASFWVQGREPLEIRLAAYAGSRPGELREWWAVTFGEGSWRLPTEKRGLASVLAVGDEVRFSPRLAARILEVDPQSHRLIRIRFECPEPLREIYRVGRPIQYSYHDAELEIWDVQTGLAQLPLSVEPPSALLPFSWQRLLSLRARTRFLLHGAGLSSTGDVVLDARLPLAEYYRIPEETWNEIERVKDRQGRVIAIGTTVARALESAVRSSHLEGSTQLRLGAMEPVRCIDGLLTGHHEPGTSHYALEEALVSQLRLRAAFDAANIRGFRGHEFGDSVLILK